MHFFSLMQDYNKLQKSGSAHTVKLAVRSKPLPRAVALLQLTQLKTIFWTLNFSSFKTKMF